MKKLFFCFFPLMVLLQLHAQNRTTDSLREVLKEATTDTGKSGRVYILTRLAGEYLGNSLDTALLISSQAYKLAGKANDPDGLSRAANIIGTVYLRAGNYSKALEYYIQKLKIEEKRNNPEMLAIALMNIAGVHQKQENYKKAIAYTFQCDSIIDVHHIARLKKFTLLNLGDMFEKSGELLLALDYTHKAYALALKNQDADFEGAALNNLGNIYTKMNNPQLAIENYKNALPLLEEAEDFDFMAESTIGLSKQYKLLGKNDSALFYAKQSYELSKDYGFLNKQMNAGLLLTEFYKNKNDFKIAFHFQEEAFTINDSIFSKDRIARTQFLTMEEELRQKEMAEKKAAETQERIEKLQYLFIALMLPVLFFITLYLSNRRIKPKYIEFLGIVSLLLSFEFIMLILHPYVGRITHHLPLYSLMIFAGIASVLTPAHHRIEQWLLKILTSKERVELFKIRIQ